MATTAPMYLYSATSNGDGTYNVTNAYNYSNITVTDTDDGGSDTLTQLGDIPNDDVQDSLGFTTTYVRALANGNGFVTTAYGRFYVFQYAPNYQDGDSFNTVSSSFTICFASGTAIATTHGPVAIDDLKVGDVAVTASGATRDIIWIGRRTLDCSGENAHMAPVRVKANAFGAGVPERDVLMSPGHPVMVRQNGREVLVPV
ncbi:Hint domain-containing protein, partial [Jiella marina]|uniref:Hint domain-containing protein n=1 Tax=Jiella sp. LLJ827 TaxID=2917712 RepID=UPI002100C4A2